jgi:FkbM family methyltransferase
VTDAEGARLREALSRIGRNELLRARFLDACRLVESLPENAYTTPREELTGPLVDALHGQVGVVRKELSNGVVFDFYYRSRIARDFVMSVPEKPDHVWEPQTTKLLLQLSAGAGHVVVGGAYFGDQAVLVAHALREAGGLCHAFEPDAEQAAMLEHNARLNGLGNLRVNAVGLWSDSRTRLRLVGHDALASPVAAEGEEAGEQTYPTTTVDEYLDRCGVGRVGLIMLDLEGGELSALRGARRQLSLPPGLAPHVVFEVHRSYVDWSGGLPNTEILRYLSSFGYTAFAVRDFQNNYDMRGRPVELIPAADVYLEGPPHGFNMLAVKDAAVLGDRVRFCRGVSPKLLLHREPALHHPGGGAEPAPAD